ncbi:MAG: hypothetical protein EPO07_07550, partial [Verrucomicrobia bacterium]
MKKLLTITLSAALAVSAFAQGKVSMNNLSTALMSTNNGAGGAGVTGTAAQGFYYGLLTAASTVTTVDASGQNLLTPTWTFTGNGYATNIAAGGRLTSGTITTTTGWPLGVTNSYIIVGWSSNMGHDWSQVAAQLSGANFTGTSWSGGGINPGEYLGFSSVAYGSVDSGGVTTYNLFGTVPTAQGNPLTAGFSMYTAVPEPTSF